MRKLSIAYLPALIAFAVTPAAAQVSGRVRIDIPIGRPAVIHGVPHREVIVQAYDPYLFGDWEDYYDLWSPVTLYLYGGHYYDYPIVEWAQPVVVYRYRNQVFFPPRDQRFVTWRGERGRYAAPLARPRPRLVEPRRDNRQLGRVERAPSRVAPYRGGGVGRPAAPSRGGRTAAPSRGGRSAAPSRGGRSAAPSRGGRSAAPSRGGRTAAPSRGGSR
ncbi:MAG: hypothetical protein ACREL5_02440 [Gemmatimonadales bacterium]